MEVSQGGAQAAPGFCKKILFGKDGDIGKGCIFEKKGELIFK